MSPWNATTSPSASGARCRGMRARHQAHSVLTTLCHVKFTAGGPGCVCRQLSAQYSSPVSILYSNTSWQPRHFLHASQFILLGDLMYLLAKSRLVPRSQRKLAVKLRLVELRPVSKSTIDAVGKQLIRWAREYRDWSVFLVKRHGETNRYGHAEHWVR